MEQHIAYDIHRFDFIQSVVVIPHNTIWYRAYDRSLPVLPNVPLFLGDMEVAYLYARQANRPLGEFKTKKMMRLLDMRYITSILPQILSQTTIEVDILRKISLALGLCSFNRQIEILEKLPQSEYPWVKTGIDRMRAFAALEQKPLWANEVELRGVRIGITNIDYDVMYWLKLLLYPVIDGIIAPALPTPFHDQKSRELGKSVMYQELILFNPNEALEHVCDRPVTPRYQFYNTTRSFNDYFVKKSYPNMVNENTGRIARYRSPQKIVDGGSDTIIPFIKDKTGEMLASDPVFRKQYEETTLLWKKQIKVLKRKCPYLRKAFTCCELVIESKRNPSGTILRTW